MNNLHHYGWDSFFQEGKESSSNAMLDYGRVISVHKSLYEVITTQGTFLCEILGSLQHNNDPLGLPAVGDWVLLDRYNETRIIHEVMKRKSIIKRKKKHDASPKPIAANIDTAVIVQSVGSDFNIKRLDRILIHVLEAHITPLVVINKADLLLKGDREKIQQELSGLNSDIPVLFTSQVTGDGLTKLQKLLVPGTTVIFIGSSGVGKSSLINTLIGRDVQKTNIITERTGKGKHTTTARRLLLLETGVLVIDTPGTREFGIHDEAEEAIKENFSVIEETALNCHFSNCSHTNEKNCAVQKALAEGAIDTEQYMHYVQLQKQDSHRGGFSK